MVSKLPMQNKTSQETDEFGKFLDPEENPRVFYTDNSLEFGKACEDLQWDHGASTHHGPETNGMAKRAVRSLKEGHLVLFYCSPDSMNSGGQDPWKVIVICAMSKIFHRMGELHVNGVVLNFSVGQSYHSEISSDINDRTGEAPSIRQESTLSFFFYGIRIGCGRKVERRPARCKTF